MQWLQATVATVHPTAIQLREFYIDGVDYVPIWYQDILAAARTHAASDTYPTLGKSERPSVDLRKTLLKDLCQQMNLDLAGVDILDEDSDEDRPI